LRRAEVLRGRYRFGHAALLFLTDRCPVGCAHCSVDSRKDSPTIRDFALFEELVDAIAADEELDMVGISGGEPFVERRGLKIATDAFAAAGKDVVLYTSGVWARSKRVPGWVPDVVRNASTIFLSTDAYHADAIDDERYVRAARTIADCGVPIVVQVLDIPEMVEQAERLLVHAFGADFEAHAEISLIEPLPYGRGERLFARPPLMHAGSIGPCALLAAPVVRYDGVVTACCNEQVIMGRGPNRLRRRCESGADLAATLVAMRDDPLLTVIGKVRAGAVVMHPRFADLASRRFHGICDLCWHLQDREPAPLGDRSDRLLTAMTVLTTKEAV
jgi:organic radical activating enzyme